MISTILSPSVLPIVLVFMIPLLAIICHFSLEALKIVKGDSGRGAPQERLEETELIQDIHRGLQQMEERIGTLETILLDRERHRAAQSERNE